MNKIEEKRKRINDLQNEIEKIKEELKEIHEYESIFILNVNTGIKNYKNILDEISKITDHPVIEEVGVKMLAYEIDHNSEGYYILINFVGDSEMVRELEKYYRTQDEILKFVTVAKDEK